MGMLALVYSILTCFAFQPKPAPPPPLTFSAAWTEYTAAVASGDHRKIDEADRQLRDASKANPPTLDERRAAYEFATTIPPAKSYSVDIGWSVVCRIRNATSED